MARERNRILRDLAANKKYAFMRSFIGKTIEAITLASCGAGAPLHEARGDNQSGGTTALTDNYLKLLLKGDHAPNRWLRARIEDVVEGVLVGIFAA